MKKSIDSDPFMPPPEYGKSLQGITINLLVDDLTAAHRFHVEVLQATMLHADDDLIIAQWHGTQWMVHADHTYDKHDFLPYAQATVPRGAGIEIRLHNADPDAMARRAEAAGFRVLVPAKDQPDHGLREAHIIDAAGYVWVPDVHLA